MRLIKQQERNIENPVVKGHYEYTLNRLQTEIEKLKNSGKNSLV